MKPKYPLIFLIVISITACKKDNDAPAAEPIPLVKARIDLGSGGTSIYDYDKSNRMVRLASNIGTKTEYTYSPGSAKAQGYAANGSPGGTVSWEVNKDGIGTRSTASNGVVTNYELNADGKVARASYNNVANTIAYDSRYYYNKQNGLLDSIRYFENDVWKSSVAYPEYYMDKINTTANENTGLLLFGRGSQRPVKQILTKIPMANNSIMEIRSDYNYEFDARTG